jgi:ribosomal protein L32
MTSACWSGYSPASWTLRMFHKPIFSSLFKTESTAWQVMNQRHGLVKMVHDNSSFSNSKVRYISSSDTPTHCLSHTHWHFGFSLESHCHGLGVQNCFFMSRASGMKILHYKPPSKRQICGRMKLRHRVTFHTHTHTHTHTRARARTQHYWITGLVEWVMCGSFRGVQQACRPFDVSTSGRSTCCQRRASLWIA